MPYDHEEPESDQESQVSTSSSDHEQSSPERVAYAFASQAVGGASSGMAAAAKTTLPLFGTVGTSALKTGQAPHIPTKRFVSARVPEEMPRVGTKSAPRKFKGEYDYVESFFRQYEQMCQTYNLYDPAEKCERILDYVDRKVERFIASSQAYRLKDWDALKAVMLEYYDAERKDSRYSLRHLKKLVNKWRHRQMKNLETWKKYGREFLTISGWLITNKLLTIDQEAAYYWHGIRKDLRQLLETRYYTQHPNVTRMRAIPMVDVNKLAGHHFARFRFDKNLVDSDTSDDSDDVYSESESSSSDSDSESDNSESEDDRKSRKKRKAKERSKKDKKKQRKKKREDDKLSDNEVERIMEERKTKGKESSEVAKVRPNPEVTDLIDRMSRMSISDPSYGAMYYQVTHLDPSAALCVRAPELSPARRYESRRDRIPGIIPRPEGQSIPRFSIQPRQCYGCGLDGHVVRDCKQLLDFMQNGIIHPDDRGYRYADGSRVPRVHGETLVETIRKRAVAKSPSANYVSAMTESDAYSVAYESDEDSVAEAFALNRTEGKAKSTRKEAQDKPRKVPRQGTGAKVKEMKDQKSKPEHQSAEQGLESKPAPSKREGVKTRSHHPQLVGQDINNPLPRPIHREKQPDSRKPVPAPIPADVRVPREIVIDQSVQDVEMKDAPAVKTKKTGPQPVKVTVKDQPDVKPIRRYGPRHSDLTKQVNTDDIVRKVLEAPVTISVQEALGASRNISESIREMLRLKRGIAVEEAIPAVSYGHIEEARSDEESDEEEVEEIPRGIAAAMEAERFWKGITTRDKAALIYLQLECGNNEIKGIVDTGAMLSIVRRDIYQSNIRRPMLPNEVMEVKDANGNLGLLQGLARRVPLPVGEVLTKGNLFVGDNLPFELILGRPWIRDNLVSIIERENGTYLQFGRTPSGDVYELCVYEETVPARIGQASEKVWKIKQPHLNKLGAVGKIFSITAEDAEDMSVQSQYGSGEDRSEPAEDPSAQMVVHRPERRMLLGKEPTQSLMDSQTIDQLASRILAYRSTSRYILMELGQDPYQVNWDEIRMDPRVTDCMTAIQAVSDSGWPEELLDLMAYPDIEQLEEPDAVARIADQIREYELENLDGPLIQWRNDTEADKIIVRCHDRIIEARINLDQDVNLAAENSPIWEQLKKEMAENPNIARTIMIEQDVFCSYHNVVNLEFSGDKIPTALYSQPGMQEEMILGWTWSYHNLELLRKAGLRLALVSREETTSYSPVAETTISDSSSNESEQVEDNPWSATVNAVITQESDDEIHTALHSLGEHDDDSASIMARGWDYEKQALEGAIVEVETLWSNMHTETPRVLMLSAEESPKEKFPDIGVPDITVVIFKPPEQAMNRVSSPTQGVHVWWKDWDAQDYTTAYQEDTEAEIDPFRLHSSADSMPIPWGMTSVAYVQTKSYIHIIAGGNYVREIRIFPEKAKVAIKLGDETGCIPLELEMWIQNKDWERMVSSIPGSTVEQVVVVCSRQPTPVQFTELQFNQPFRMWAGYLESDDGTAPQCYGPAPYLAIYMTQLAHSKPHELPMQQVGKLKEDLEYEEVWRTRALRFISPVLVQLEKDGVRSKFMVRMDTSPSAARGIPPGFYQEYLPMSEFQLSRENVKQILAWDKLQPLTGLVLIHKGIAYPIELALMTEESFRK